MVLSIGMAAQRDVVREMAITALAGSLGGALAKAITYPLETTKLWLARKKSDETSADVIKLLWRTGIYIGIKMRLLKNIIHSFAFFWVMEGITLLAKATVNKTRSIRGLPRASTFGMPVFLLAGFCGDALNIPMITPLEFVLTQMMTSRTRETFVSVVKRTHLESGIAGFYVGWPVYLMAAVRPAVKYGLFDYFKTLLLRRRGKDAALSVMQAFWLAVVTAAISSTMLYPLNTARIVITSRRKNGDNGSKTDLKAAAALKADAASTSDDPIEVVCAIAKKEGIAGLYKGLTSEILEGMLGAAIQLVFKEKVTESVRKLVYVGKA